MQQIGAEMNLSETAFIEPVRSGASVSGNPFVELADFNLRWFTPRTEVDLCGHATMASAAVLFEGMEKAVRLLLQQHQSSVKHSLHHSRRQPTRSAAF